MLLVDAINICLRYIGEAPIPSSVDIDTLDPQHEAVIIRTMLQEVSKTLQSRGWWFNTEDWVFTPDTNNHIGISSDVISLKTDKDVIVRGGSLYDRKNKTYEFDSQVKGTVIWEWVFEDLPHVFADYVVYETAQQAQVFFNGDDFIDRDLQKKVALALVAVEREHLRQTKPNMIKNTRIVSRTTIPTPVS